jgi:two-component system nitrogen regulation response regulator GlnG
MPNLVLIDDDRSVLFLVTKAFQDTPITVQATTSVEEGLELVKQGPDVVLLDLVLPGTSGLDVAKKIQAIDAKLPVIFVTARGTSETAIEAMKLGAYDYVLKPLDLRRLRELVERALETRRLMQVRVELPKQGSYQSSESDPILGRSPAMQETFKAIGRVAPRNITTLIHGESGTGKELVARAIYQHSDRASKPFLAINCAAIPENLLESELFGHEKGSFTSADQRRIGRFEQCNGGTIFLDEVGDMSPLLQSKVLRLLQEQRFERVGGTDTIKTDVRIVAATNRHLKEMASKGEFREDLYYRLNGFTIELPPLRERGEDIPLLLEHFLRKYAKEFAKEVDGIAPEALELMMTYRWPGNVRELEAVVRQSLLKATGPVLVPDDLPGEVRQQRAPAASEAAGGLPSDLAPFVDDCLRQNATTVFADATELMERYVITRILHQTEGNQSQAARILGITRGCLRNKMRTLRISLGTRVTMNDEPVDEADEELTTSSTP